MKMPNFQRPHDGKAPFAAPKLQIYGSARDITRAILLVGAADGALNQELTKTTLI